MRFFYLTVLIGTLAFCSSTNSNAQTNAPKIEDIYDWSTGDSLAQWIYWSIDCPTQNPSCVGTGGQGLISWVVLDRWEMSDTLFYKLRTNDDTAAVLMFVNKDSAVTQLSFLPFSCLNSALDISGPWDPLYESPSPDSLSLYHFIINGADIWLKERVGLYGLHANAIVSYNPAGHCFGYPPCDYYCEVKTVYYKLDSLEWIDSAYYFPTGIDKQVREVELQLFPNPANDMVNLLMKNIETPNMYKVEVTDLRGTRVYERTWSTETVISVPLTGLPFGIYFVSVEDDANCIIARRRIVKQ